MRITADTVFRLTPASSAVRRMEPDRSQAPTIFPRSFWSRAARTPVWMNSLATRTALASGAEKSSGWSDNASARSASVAIGRLLLIS